MDKHTDNSNLAAKLKLRRYFLQKYHADGSTRVLDCCQGEGLIWRELRKEFEVVSYWGLDLKPKPGRLKIDSVRVLEHPGLPYNVFDVDTYGSPWKHWKQILRNAQMPCTVFLTVGRSGPCRVRLSPEELAAMGLTIPRVGQFPSITHNLAEFSVRCCLTESYGDRIILFEAVEALSDGNARYIGVHLKREQPGANQAALSVQLDKEAEPCPIIPTSRPSTAPKRSKKSAASPTS